MALFDKLARGFVQSAVNQVGRDSGRVISNRVYCDAHATPIRRVDSSATSSVSGSLASKDGVVEVSQDEVRRSCIEGGYKLKLSRTSVGQVVGVALLGAIPLFISPALFALAAIRRIWYFFSDDAIYAKRAMLARRVPDRRYSLGYRVEGYEMGWDEVKIPPTLIERMGHLAIAFLYIVISAGLSYYSYWAIEQMSKL